MPLILIVDDNLANLTVLGELLQPRHAVRVANSGLRALRLARLKPQPGLILSAAATGGPPGGSNPGLDPAWQVVLYQQSQDAVYLLDTQGRVLQANPRFAELLGLRPADAAALRLWDWDIDHPQAQALALLVPGAAAPAGFKLRWRHRQGGERWVETRLQRSPQAGPARLLCISRDITARHQTDVSLRQSEARCRATCKNLALGLAENALDGRWLSVNLRLCQISGYVAAR